MQQARVREWLALWVQDMRFASRWFRRAPGFVLATVLTLALGIGAATAIFSVVRGVLLRPLPYPVPDRLVQVWQVDAAGKRMQFSDPNFDDVRARSRVFSGLAEFAGATTVSVAGDIAPTRAAVTNVSRDFFDILGIQPILGRTFAPDEQRENGPPTVVVSWGFWQRVWGGRASALGQRLTIGDRTYTVIGVMRPALDFPLTTDMWISRELVAPFPSRTAHNWQVVGRIHPGVTDDAAQRDVHALARALAGQYGSQTMMADAALVPLRDQLVGSTRPTLLVLLAASVLLLVIGCANVANLLVARLMARRSELALRLALGAGPSRLAQQCLAESVVLSLAGGALGVVAAMAGTRALLSLDPSQLPRTYEVRMDGLVLAFALALSLVTAVALALLTAWRAMRTDVREMLSASERVASGAGSATQARRTLVVAQVAMTIVLLIGAGLLGRSLLNLLAVDPGFRVERRVVLDLSIEADDSVPRIQRAAFYHELLTRFASIPGVTAVGAVNAIPLDLGGTSSGTFLELGSPDEKISMADFEKLAQNHARSGYAEFRVASGGYFTAMHIPLLEGRTFDERDAPTAPHVAVVSASLAKARWPGASPIGKWIYFGNMDGDVRPFTIVGVVGDVRDGSLNAPAKPTFYADYIQRPVAMGRMNVVLVGPNSPTGTVAAADAIVRALRPDVSPRFRTMESIVASSIADRRMVLVLVGAFGAAALLLAAMGLYSVVSYLVAQRTQELRVRVALGARESDIVQLVLRDGTILAAGGIALGTVVALVVMRLLANLLYGVTATDPTAFVASVLAVGFVTLAASWLPAHRAASAANSSRSG